MGAARPPWASPHKTTTLTRLDALPEIAIIKGLKGVVDFYYWKGLAVARAWPRKALYTPSPQEQASRSQFGENLSAMSAMPSEVITGVMPEIQNNGWTWRDAWTSSIYGHNQQWP